MDQSAVEVAAPFKRETSDGKEFDLKKIERGVIKLARNNRGMVGAGIILGEEFKKPVLGFWTDKFNRRYEEHAFGAKPTFETHKEPPKEPNNEGYYIWQDVTREKDPGVPAVLRKYGYEDIADQIENKGDDVEVNVLGTNISEIFLVHSVDGQMLFPPTMESMMLPKFLQRALGRLAGAYIIKNVDEKVVRTDGEVVRSKNGKVTQIKDFKSALISVEVQKIPKDDKPEVSTVYYIINYDPNYKYKAPLQRVFMASEWDAAVNQWKGHWLEIDPRGPVAGGTGISYGIGGTDINKTPLVPQYPEPK